MHSRIVILTDHSLFVEGVISRLTRQPEQLDLQAIDLNQPNALVQIISACPTVIILDGSYPEVLRPFTLQDLIQFMPELIIIQLEQQKRQIKVLRCRQHLVDEIRDLVDLIEAITSE